jgi:Protein of unknown function (DUF4236)
MTIRFWRRKRFGPFRANFSKSGVSLSVGQPGMWATVGRRGKRVTLGAPGSGLFWTKLSPRRALTTGAGGRQWRLGVLIAIAAIVGLVIAGQWISAHP